MRARTPLFLALTFALTCVALGGCGQTGVLYLPSKEGEVVSKGPEAATTPAATDPAAEAEATRKRAQPATPNPAPQ